MQVLPLCIYVGENVRIKVAQLNPPIWVTGLFHVEQGLYGQAVTVQSEAAYHTLAGRTYDATAAELLTLVHIADVNLHNRGIHTLDGVHQCKAVMGVGTGVQHDTIQIKTHFMYLVYQFPLHIALEVVNADIWKCVAQDVQIFFKTLLAINLRLSDAQQVQIGTIDDLNSHNKYVYLRVQRYKKNKCESENLT